VLRSTPSNIAGSGRTLFRCEELERCRLGCKRCLDCELVTVVDDDIDGPS
jgi:hypothetical protein